MKRHTWILQGIHLCIPRKNIEFGYGTTLQYPSPNLPNARRAGLWGYPHSGSLALRCPGREVDQRNQTRTGESYCPIRRVGRTSGVGKMGKNLSNSSTILPFFLDFSQHTFHMLMEYKILSISYTLYILLNIKRKKEVPVPKYQKNRLRHHHNAKYWWGTGLENRKASSSKKSIGIVEKSGERCEGGKQHPDVRLQNFKFWATWNPSRCTFFSRRTIRSARS